MEFEEFLLHPKSVKTILLRVSMFIKQIPAKFLLKQNLDKK